MCTLAQAPLALGVGLGQPHPPTVSSTREATGGTLPQSAVPGTEEQVINIGCEKQDDPSQTLGLVQMSINISYYCLLSE